MGDAYKSKLYKWVMESFGDSTGGDSTNLSVNNTSSNNNTPYAGSVKMGGNNLPVSQDIAGEDLKNKNGGVAKLKDLKQVVDNYIRDIKTATEECLAESATDSSYSQLLDIIQKPEVLAKLEHIREELSLAKQNQGLQMNGTAN
jgi:hypothetical protein